MTHMYLSHVNESCHECDRVMFFSMRRDLFWTDEFRPHNIWHTCTWYMTHMYLSHGNESCHTCNWVMSFSVWRDSFTCVVAHHVLCGHYSFSCVTWLISMCDMTYPCVWVWHDSRAGVQHSNESSCVVAQYVVLCGRDSFTCVPWLIYMCDMTLCVLHDSLAGVRHSYESSCVVAQYILCGRDSFTCVTWLTYMCDMTHLCVSRVW
jgi:hypothetical protein